MSTARMFHSIADEFGCAPELVGSLAREAKLRKKDDVRERVREHLIETGELERPKRKGGLTLSQRRAMLRLLDEERIVPESDFRAQPFRKLVDLGYAATDGDGFVLTEEGQERAESINPGYRVWAAGESVAGAEGRAEAGTHRAKRAEEAAKTAAEAAAKAAQAEEAAAQSA